MLGTAKQQPWLSPILCGPGAVSSSFTARQYQGNNLTITKALLNVIADAKTKVYGDADPSLTYQVSVTW